MTTAPATPDGIEVEPTPREWYLFLVAGAVNVGIGLLVIAYPSPSLKLLGVFIGVDLLIAGVVLIVRALSGKASTDAAQGHLLLGVLGLIGGVVVVRNPGATIAVLALAFAVYLIVAGALALAEALLHSGHRLLNLVKGLVMVGFGTVIVSMPEIGLGTLAWLTGLALILQGAVEIGEAFFVRSERM